MAHLKNRRPEFILVEDVGAAMRQFDKTTKADWCDLYFDLYRQCFGGMIEGEEILIDVQKRLEILKHYRELADGAENFPQPDGTQASRI